MPFKSLHFIWKCGSVLDIQQANKVIHIIENSIDVYHTRAMRKEFHEKFGLISKAHPAVLNEMYRYLTNDCTVPQSNVSKKVRSRILAAIDSQDTSVVFDMRNLTHEDETKFDDFFNEVEKFINEYELKAVDDRRHGLVSHLDVALSADLRNQIVKRLPQGSAIPSVE